jgi:hypothetical protein
MLVTFTSSETGELMMFAEVAGALLRAAGKETLRRGAFTRDEMEAAARVLRAAVERAGAPPPAARDDAGETGEAPVALGPRAWPLIDMLERTARGGPHANIVWEAAADF